LGAKKQQMSSESRPEDIASDQDVTDESYASNIDEKDPNSTTEGTSSTTTSKEDSF
jgi:hypothetical protein